MNKLLCAIGITLLFSSIYMAIINTEKDIFIEFNNMLDLEQQIKYKHIIKERVSIYITGTIIGFLVALYYITHIKNIKATNICVYLTIVLGIQLIYYKIHPKSELMLYHLKTKQQVEKWADIYTYMKTKWINSLIFGFIGFLAVGCSI